MPRQRKMMLPVSHSFINTLMMRSALTPLRNIQPHQHLHHRPSHNLRNIPKPERPQCLYTRVPLSPYAHPLYLQPGQE